jgi:competence protein ComEA
MPELRPRTLAALAAAAAAMLVLGFAQVRRTAGGTPGAPAKAATAPLRVDDGAGDRTIVHVVGAVRRPGVYRLPASARVQDAVARAGGATRRADLAGLNLAAKVEDGRQVLVPERPRPGVTGGAPTAAPAKSQPLNLNTATLEQLDELTGVGPTTAQKILDYRKEKGGFGTVDELGEIPGIGDKRLATLREEARV